MLNLGVQTDPELLRKARMRLGLSQEELAKEAGVNRSLIANIEKKRRRLTEKVGKPLWDALIRVEADRQKGVIKEDEVVLMWELFARARQIAGLSLKRVAKKIGVDEEALAALERGEGHLPDGKISDLVDFYERRHDKHWKWNVDSTEKMPFMDLAHAQLLAEKKKRRERSTRGGGSGVPLSRLGFPGPLVDYVDPVKKERAALLGYVESLEKIIASHEKSDALSKEIHANQEEIIKELKTEIARLELLNKEISESKDREIQSLRGQLAKNKAVTIPPDDTWDSGVE